MSSLTDPERYRLTRGGILNVWQYDDQVFTFGGGRLLLRGTNGAGKSKTLEMLLPFVLDGDKARMTASGRHHTSLLWLMTDGYEGASRTGYLWVELSRPGDDGVPVTVTCGVGIRASDSARTATAWFFTSPRRVGVDLLLEDASGPLAAPRCRAEVERDGQFFDSARRYREHVGRLLFGLPPDQYDELLRLLYWLRQPQVGEDIEPRRLAEQLVQALPQVDETAVRSAGDTFDELEAFGEQLERRDRAATAVADFVGVYSGYARGVVRARAEALVDADRQARQRRSELRRSQRSLEQVARRLDDDRAALSEARGRRESATTTIVELEKGPEARAQQRILDLGTRVSELEAARRRSSDVAASAGTRARQSAQDAGRHGADLVRESGRLHGELTRTCAAMTRAGWVVPLSVPPGLASPTLAERADADALIADTQDMRERQNGALPVLGEMRAAVLVVQQAGQELAQARRAVHAAEERVTHAEERAERAAAVVDRAAADSSAQELDFTGRLRAWQQAEHAAPLTLPELTEDGLAALEATALGAAAPRRAALEERLGVARAAIRDAESRQASLRGERARIEAQRDPSPAAPTWRRDARDALAGAPLWRLVDFRDDLPAGDCAGLEAALEGAGLLDAWVCPDGRVLGRDRHDVVLTAGAPAAGARLSKVLTPDVPADAEISESLVADVLSRIGLVDDAQGVQGDEPAPMVVDASGQWRAGPLRGRTTKDAAQYIGATARAAERARRLAVVDEELARLARALADAALERDRAANALAALDAWLAARPRHEGVLRAWAALAAAEAAAAVVARELQEATEHAEAARATAARRHQELDRLGALHGLPVTAEGLAARGEQLADIATRLGDEDRQLSQLALRAVDWAELVRRRDADAADATTRHTEEMEAKEAAAQAATQLAELRAAVGASVQQLEQRLSSLRAQVRESTALGDRLEGLVDGHHKRLGTLEAELRAAQRADEASGPMVSAAGAELGALVQVHGLVASALRADLPGVGVDEVAAADVQTARALVGLPSTAREADANAVLAASRDLQSGPAATVEPRVFEVMGVLAAVGRDEARERPLTELAERLRQSVEADRALLTERERRLFEDHVLGHLGDSLRGVRTKADELVAAMNLLMSDVSTSQGIRMRLRWRLRDDIPSEAKCAVQLLGEPVGALLPDERRELREALHRLITVSRSEAPEDSYADHLARALDYRQWFAFTIQYHRPGARDWVDLHRKSPLSQGEQKVLCYLPLFAAAGAHFTSLAGAAPHAPRFVLLDDAFPKIDVRTHPLLFGLLVDLDLDFVITSERLWGDHDTVPELAIYEALRSPTERGIAQYQHHWDGHRLKAIGA